MKAKLSLLGFLSILTACTGPSQSTLTSLTGANPGSGSSSSTTATTFGAPATISVFAGSGQGAVYGNQLSSALVARVLDSNGVAVPGATVTFTNISTCGGACVGGQGPSFKTTTVTTAPVVLTTDASGEASVNLILGTYIGAQTVKASVAGVVDTGAAGTRATFTETSTEFSSQVKIIQVGQTVSFPTSTLFVGGTPVYLEAVLMDTNNNIIAPVAVNWSTNETLNIADLTLTSGASGGGSVIGAGNLATYATYAPSSTGAGQILASVTDGTTIQIDNIISTSGATGQITNSLSLTPDHISLGCATEGFGSGVVNNQTAQVGTSLGQPLYVTVQNVANTPVPGTNVTFTVQSGGGQIVSGQPAVTDANGCAYANVKVGGLAGNNTNAFTATIAVGSVKQVLFNANTTFGPAAQLSFTQQPGGAEAGTAFSAQPIVQVRDQYGNLVLNDNSDVVTLTVNSSSSGGTLGGTATATAVNGIAQFSNVSFSLGDTGVVLHAASGVLGTANSSSFPVGSIIAAAQCAGGAPANFVTADGGCKDKSTGLVWSAGTVGNVPTGGSVMGWYSAVWDGTASGNPPQEPWQTSFGRNFITDIDYTQNTGGEAFSSQTTYTASSSAPLLAGASWTQNDPTYGDFPANGAAYCQNLNESGMTDWRMPTLNEANLSLGINNGSSALQNTACPGSWWWTATLYGGRYSFPYTYLTTPGSFSQNYGWYNNNYCVRCVRNGPPSTLLVSQQVSGSSSGLAVNVPFAQQPSVRIVDDTNSIAGSAGTGAGNQFGAIPVTLTVTSCNGGGACHGQLCVTNLHTGVTNSCSNSKTITAVSGIANFGTIGGAFAGLSYSYAESVTLTASAVGIGSVALTPFTVNQTYPMAACLSVGGNWINGIGGCKDATTGLIYSAGSNATTSGTSYTWHDVVWNQNTVGLNAGTAKTTDNGITQDYVVVPGNSVDDASSLNYCHSLSESGQNDWRPLPNVDLSTKSIGTYLNQYTNFWNNNRMTVVDLGYNPDLTQSWYNYNGLLWNDESKSWPDTRVSAQCVREDPPAQLQIAVQPDTNNTYGFADGMSWDVQPTINILDAQGAGPLVMEGGLLQHVTNANLPTVMNWDPTATVTITVAPAADGSGGHGNLIQWNGANSIDSNIGINPTRSIVASGHSISSAPIGGQVAFTGLAYTLVGTTHAGQGEKFRLAVTASGRWEGSNWSIGPVYTNDVTIPAVNTGSQCAPGALATAWKTQNGGCQDQVSGLVWTQGFGDAGDAYGCHVWNTAPTCLYTWVNWFSAIWDSAFSGGDLPRSDGNGPIGFLQALWGGDAFDGGSYFGWSSVTEGATNTPSEYDVANPPGTGPKSAGSFSGDACHRMRLNGYDDWRLPTVAEVQAAISHQFASSINDPEMAIINASGYQSYFSPITSTTDQGTNADYCTYSYTGAHWCANPKTNSWSGSGDVLGRAHCVRNANLSY